jgi:hypothetical protein
MRPEEQNPTNKRATAAQINDKVPSQQFLPPTAAVIFPEQSNAQLN